MRDAIKKKYELLKNYKKTLNKKDPLDKQILKLVKNKELTVGFAEIKEPNNITMYNINLDSLSKSERAYLIKKRKFLKYNLK